MKLWNNVQKEILHNILVLNKITTENKYLKPSNLQGINELLCIMHPKLMTSNKERNISHNFFWTWCSRTLMSASVWPSWDCDSPHCCHQCQVEEMGDESGLEDRQLSNKFKRPSTACFCLVWEIIWGILSALTPPHSTSTPTLTHRDTHRVFFLTR